MQRMLRPAAAVILGVAVLVTAFFAIRVYAQERDDVIVADETSAASPNETNIGDATLSVGNFLTYQGVLLDPANNPRPSGTYGMTFRLYREDATVRWTETQNVLVANGYFSTRLGIVTPINPGMFVNNQLTLGVQVTGDTEMTPRQPLTQVPYAMNAQRLEQFRSFGVVNANGSAGNGFRFNSSIQNVGGLDTYVIDVGEDFNINNFIATASPIYNSTCPFAVSTSVGSGSGRLLVNLFTASGAPVFCSFNFTVLSIPN